MILVHQMYWGTMRDDDLRRNCNLEVRVDAEQHVNRVHDKAGYIHAQYIDLRICRYFDLTHCTGDTASTASLTAPLLRS